MSDDAMFLVGESGEPLGVFNVDIIQAEGTAFSYALAAAAGDRDELDRVAAEVLQRVGAEGFGYVAAAAARQLAEGVVGPLLDVIDATRQATGAPAHDLRAGLAEARDYSLAVAVTLRARPDSGGEGR